MKTQITSNITKVSERYRRMSRNLPGVIDKATKALVEDEALPLFEKTVQTWGHQPRFYARKAYHGYGVSVEPETPWEWINRGVKGRTITPKRKPYLVFNWPYTAATKPGWIASRQARQGDNIARKLSVDWPGIKARNFTDIIMRRVQARAVNKMRQALSDASYGAGMGI